MSTTDDGAAPKVCTCKMDDWTRDASSENGCCILCGGPLPADPAPVEPAGDPVRDDGAWLPIKTAPKNGTCVLYMTLLARGFVYGVAYFEEGDWICNASGADVHPTHWRPIPAPSALARDVEPAPPALTAERAPETARELLARADMLLHDAEGDDESMAHGLVHDAAAFLSDREDVRADVRAQYAKPEPPHGHQAPPAAPVGGVSEAVEAVVEALKLAIACEGEGQQWVDDGRKALAAFAARPTPDDGCPKGDPDCLGGNGDCHDAGSTFAERGAVEAAVTAEREACAALAEAFGNDIIVFYERPGGPPGNSRRALQGSDVAVAIRSRASTPAAIDGLAPGGRDGTEE